MSLQFWTFDNIVDPLRHHLRSTEAEFKSASIRILSQALNTKDSPLQMSETDILSWAIELSPELQSLQQGTKFSDLQITLHRDDDIVVQLMIWLTGTTSIHDHSFYGAFCVLAGTSLHTQFSFEGVSEISSKVSHGKLDAGHAELLSPGDVRPISAGEGLIHSVYHMGRPSISLVIAGGGEALQRSRQPCEYVGGKLRIEDTDPSIGAIKRARALQLLFRLQENVNAQSVISVLERTDDDDLYQVLRALDSELSALAVVEVDRINRYLGKRGFADIRKTLMAERSTATLINMRARISDPDARLIVALLAVVGNPFMWHDIFKRFDKIEPRKAILDERVKSAVEVFLRDRLFAKASIIELEALRQLLSAFILENLESLRDNLSIKHFIRTHQSGSLSVLTSHIDWTDILARLAGAEQAPYSISRSSYLEVAQ